MKISWKLTIADYQAQYDEIMHYNNPTVKKKLLNDFADTCEGASMTLKASAFPGQSTKVILPINRIKETEAYCPTYENGTQLALIRYPHAGTFEIPIVTVNNKMSVASAILDRSKMLSASMPRWQSVCPVQTSMVIPLW